jgi:hypothetical protein
MIKVRPEVVAMEDIDAEDFKEFLMAIYPDRKPVDCYNFAALALLADRFQVKFLMEKSRYFIANNGSISAMDKLQVVDKLGNNKQLLGKVVNSMRMVDFDKPASFEDIGLSNEAMALLIDSDKFATA